MLNDFKNHFFAELERKSPVPKTAAQILMDELGISKGAAYKKINGTIQLSLEETVLLSTKFGISLDQILANQSDFVIFKYPALQGREMSPWLFVDQLLAVLSAHSAQGGLRIRYSTCEIPLFNYLYYPELTAIKLYFYSNVVWDLLGEQRPGQAWIDQLLADQSFQEKRTRIFDLLAGTPTEEYYQANILDTTLRQIRFLQQTKQVSDTFVNTTLEQLSDMAQTIAKWAGDGQKRLSDGSPGASFELHLNEVIFTNIIFVLETDQGNCLYTTYDSPNFMMSEDVRLVNRTDAWIFRMKDKSVQISKQNEERRRVFFQSLQKSIEAFME